LSLHLQNSAAADLPQRPLIDRLFSKLFGISIAVFFQQKFNQEKYHANGNNHRIEARLEGSW
jgi:hypothetical protein